jgi:hypothetical protein
VFISKLNYSYIAYILQSFEHTDLTKCMSLFVTVESRTLKELKRYHLRFDSAVCLSSGL